jgi:hypothetical protein
VRPVTLAVVTALFVGGCGGSAVRARAHAAAFAVGVSSEVAAAAHADGVDLRRLVATSAAKALASLPHRGRIRIDVRVDPMLVIPETGVGGLTDESGDVRIAIDVERRDLRESLETWVPAMVAHEVHHSSRIRTGTGYGATLGEALVSEGLADHFASQVFPHTRRSRGITP